MKTTVDLPADLVRELKLRALRDGKKLKDAIADLLRMALGAADVQSTRPTSPRIQTDPATGLPFIKCDADAPAPRMTFEQLLKLEQETQSQEDLDRLGLSL